MDLRPNDLPDLVEGESARVEFRLRPGLNGASVLSAAWASEPGGLSFADAATADGGTTVAATVSGGQAGCSYTVTATCKLSNGLTAKPWARLRVKRAGE